MTEYISLREAAQILNVHYGTITRWVRQGKLPGVMALPDHDWRGGKRHFSRIDRAALDRWRKRQA